MIRTLSNAESENCGELQSNYVPEYNLNYTDYYSENVPLFTLLQPVNAMKMFCACSVLWYAVHESSPLYATTVVVSYFAKTVLSRVCTSSSESG